MSIVDSIRNNPRSVNKIYSLIYNLIGPNNFTVDKMVNYFRYKLNMNDDTIKNLVLT